MARFQREGGSAPALQKRIKAANLQKLANKPAQGLPPSRANILDGIFCLFPAECTLRVHGV